MDNHKIEIWKERMRACKASGISVLQYCKNNHLSKAGSKGAEGREYINLIFKLEEEIQDLPNEERKEKRQEASKAILEAFWSWV